MTLKDIAKACNVHLGTVSRALNNSPKVNEETRRKVQVAAREMGYQRDPMLRSLAMYRSKKHSRGMQTGLAYLTVAPGPFPWRAIKAFRDYFDGAARRAEELGYHLEEVVLNRHEGGKSAVRRILRARGIEGIVLAPLPHGCDSVDFDWDEFAVVALGFSLKGVTLHRAANHQFRSMVVLMETLVSKGYTRIALCLSTHIDKRVAYGWSGGFLSVLDQHFGKSAIPIFRDFTCADDAKSMRQLQKYLLHYKPEVVVGLQNIMPCLKELGYTIPGDMGFVSPAAVVEGEHLAGIDELSIEIGAAAVDLLTSEVEGRRFGVPSIPRQVLIEGVWQDGPTLR